MIPLSIGLDKDQKALETKYVEAKSLIGTLDYLAMSAMEGYGGAISEFYPHCFRMFWNRQVQLVRTRAEIFKARLGEWTWFLHQNSQKGDYDVEVN